MPFLQYLLFVNFKRNVSIKILKRHFAFYENIVSQLCLTRSAIKTHSKIWHITIAREKVSMNLFVVLRAGLEY